MRAAHRAEVGHFLRLLGQRFVVIIPRRVRVQGQVELVLPAELKAGLGQGVVADLRRRVAFGQVGGVGGDLVGDDAFLHILAVGQPQVLFGRHIAQHGRAVPADHRRADARSEVVVAGGDVRHQRPQGVERRFVAVLQLLVHILLDELHRHMAGAFDHHLHIVLPGDFGQLAQGFQLGELRGVVGVGDAAGAQAVAQRKGHVVLPHNLAHFGEVFVEETLPVVGQAPLGHNGTAPGDDARDPVHRQRHIGQAHAGVDGEVVHALFGLLNQRVPENLPGEVLRLAVHLLQRLVDRHAAHGDGAVADDPLPRFVDVAPGGQIHNGVPAPPGGPGHLFHFLLNAGSDRRVADVGVDFDQEVASDDHRFRFGMVDVGGDDGAAGGHLGAHEFGRHHRRQVGAEVHRLGAAHQRRAEELLAAHILADGDELHFRRDDAPPGVVHLRHIAAGFGAARAADVAEAVGRQRRVGQPFPPVFRSQILQPVGVAPLLDPPFPQRRQAPADINGDIGVGVRPGGVIDIHRRVLFHAGAGMGVVQRDLPHRHADVRAAARFVHLAGVGEGAHRFGIDLRVFAQQRPFDDGRHCGYSLLPGRVVSSNGFFRHSGNGVSQ